MKLGYGIGVQCEKYDTGTMYIIDTVQVIYNIYIYIWVWLVLNSYNNWWNNVAIFQMIFIFLNIPNFSIAYL